MRPSEPPVLATWLLEHVRFSNTDEALAGDLLEDFRHGRSVAWYWRQVFAAILVGFRKGGASSLGAGDSSRSNWLDCKLRCLSPGARGFRGTLSASSPQCRIFSSACGMHRAVFLHGCCKRVQCGITPPQASRCYVAGVCRCVVSVGLDAESCFLYSKQSTIRHACHHLLCRCAGWSSRCRIPCQPWS
jgi:hypothetical protein